MNGNDTGTSQISAREILTVIFRRKVPIAICAVAIAAAALSAASRTTSVYQGFAKVLVRRSGATPLATTWTPFYGLEEEMNTEVELITTETVMTRAVDLLKEKGVYLHVASGDSQIAREPTVGDIAAGLSATPVEMSNVIIIRFTGQDRAFVTEAANAVASAYVEYRVQVRSSATSEEFFADQLSVLERRLLDLRASQIVLRRDGEIYDLEWQNRAAITRRAEHQKDLADVRTKRIAAELRLEHIKTRLAEDPDILIPFSEFERDRIGGQMLAAYWSLRSQRDELASQLTDSNPQVMMFDARIEMMEKRFKEEIQRRIKEWEFQVEDLKAEEKGYKLAIAEISEELAQTPDVVAQIDHLDREIYYTYEHYDKVLEKLLDTMASEADDARISNAKVISTAQARLTKAGRMQSVYVLFSIVLGMTLGVGFGFLLESLDHSVKSAGDVEDGIGLPLLGSVPASRRLREVTGNVDRTFDQDSQRG
jgi:succinoglycan biosynthesis transport protein ExoP